MGTVQYLESITRHVSETVNKQMGNSFSELELDALKETSNVGAGNASIALSEVVNKKVELVVSDVNFASIAEIGPLLAGPQKLVVGIFTPIHESMSGNVLMMLEKENALALANQVLQIQNREDDVLTKNDEEGLKTVGAVVTEYYVKSLNDFLAMNMRCDETNIVTTFGESILDVIMANVEPDIKDVLMIKTDFTIEQTPIAGQFVLLLAVKSIDSLLAALRKNM